MVSTWKIEILKVAEHEHWSETERDGGWVWDEMREVQG